MLVVVIVLFYVYGNRELCRSRKGRKAVAHFAIISIIAFGFLAATIGKDLNRGEPLSEHELRLGTIYDVESVSSTGASLILAASQPDGDIEYYCLFQKIEKPGAYICTTDGAGRNILMPVGQDAVKTAFAK